jgi:hypothetical protein
MGKRNTSAERFFLGKDKRPDVRTRSPSGRLCLLPTHAPDMFLLHVAGNGAWDGLLWMHVANGRDACTMPPPPTLPRRAPHRMHGAPACPPAHCCRTYPCAADVSPRATTAAPASLAPPTSVVCMLLHMHVGVIAPDSLPACTRGPPPSAPTSRVQSGNTCNIICCNICPKQMNYLQTYACNICV